MKIALIGYGKMGKTIERIAKERGHEIVLTIDVTNRDALTAENLQKAEVAIEFTSPEAAFENVTFCLRHRVPVVCGSTGWLEQLPEAERICKENNSALIVASNFSVGVNIFFAINRKLAALMAKQPGYSVSITEIHHTQKKDAPSGTAISLAQQIMEENPVYRRWVNHSTQESGVLPIVSERKDPAPGTHVVKYSSEIDDIEIIHTAHNRDGFALGAVVAAEFLHNRKGIYTMNDVLQLEA